MGWHYGPCKELSWLWLIPVAVVCYVAYEIHKHLRAVEHVVALIAIGVGIFSGLCLIGLAIMSISIYRSDCKTEKPVYDAELVNYHPSEEDAIRRARELL